MSDEIYRVLDPDPPKRQGVNEAFRSAKEKPESVTKAPKENADFIEVSRKGAVEKRMLPKNRIKARLIQAAEKEFKKISEARSSDSESEGESESESESE